MVGHLCVKALVSLIRAYKVAVSPVFPASCRFTPSCSTYALDALSKYGLRKGLDLTIKRILRCHPFGGSGFDPVP